jgi:hypothetical protein
VLHRRLVHRPVRAVETEKLYSQEKTAAREVFLRAVVVFIDGKSIARSSGQGVTPVPVREMV